MLFCVGRMFSRHDLLFVVIITEMILEKRLDVSLPIVLSYRVHYCGAVDLLRFFDRNICAKKPERREIQAFKRWRK